MLDASTIDRQSGISWVLNPSVLDVRKACLFNVLAVLCCTPSVTMPLIASLRNVFIVNADSLYVQMDTTVIETLLTLVANPAQPFYQDITPPMAVHQRLLDHLPAFTGTSLSSFRAEGRPSLQLVVAESALDYTVADIDLDLWNPLQDVVSFVGHLGEVLHERVTHRPTDHLALYEQLARTKARPFLGYENKT